MKVLLDTHVILWWLDDPGQLSDSAREIIAEPSNEILVSAVSAWEIAIKRALGKLQAPDNFAEAIRLCRFVPLNITMNHALATETLPMHHRDPFDRTLIAQSQVEGAAIVTRDSLFATYGVAVVPT